MRTLRIRPARTRQAAAAMICAAMVLALGAEGARSVTTTWTGSTSANWSAGGAGGNWNGAAAPVSGDDLLFNYLSTANLSTNNNIAGLSLLKIAVVDPSGAVSIGGNPFAVTGGIDMSAATQNLAITPVVTFSGTQSIHVAAGRALTLSATPTLAAGSNVSKDGDGALSVTPLYIGNGVSNTFNVNAGTVTAANFRVGHGAGVTGTLNQTGGTINAATYLIIGGVSGVSTGTGVYNLSGTGQLVTNQLYCGWAARGEIYQSGGTITANILHSATDSPLGGRYELSGGTLNVTGGSGLTQLGFRYTTDFIQTGGNANFKNLELGSGYAAGAGTANYAISGDSQLSVASGGRFYVGGSAGGTGNFYVNGGTTTVNADMYVGAVANANGTVTQTAGTVTIDPANALRFRSTGSYSGAYNLNGGTLTLAQIDFTNAATQKFNFGGGTLRANGDLNTSMPMTLGAGGGTIDTQANAVTLSGALSGGGALSKIGSGSLTLYASSGLLGGINVNGGELIKDGSGTLSVSTLYAGNHVTSTITMKAGTLTASNFRIGDDPTSPVVGTLNQSGGTINSGTFIVGGINYYDPWPASYAGKGEYNLTDGSLSAGTMYVGWTNRGEVYQSGGTVTVTNLESATNGAGGGRYELSGGTLNVTSRARLGYRYTTDLEQTGGTANFAALYLGGTGGAGTANYTISGPSSTQLNVNGPLAVGYATGGTGDLKVQGGTVAVHGDMYVGASTNYASGMFIVDPAGIYTNTNGTVTQTAGTVTIDPANALRFRSTGSYSGAYNLNGGTLTLAQIDFTNAATQKFNFGGGTLRANGNLNTAMPMTLGAGGGTIDTQGYSVTLSGALSGSGALTKTGSGSLTLQGGSVGAVAVTAGEVIKDSGGTLNVTSAQLDVRPGTRYTHNAGTTTISGAYGVNASGSSAGDAVVTQTGGVINATGLYCIIGSNQGNSGGKAVYNMQGGELNVSNRLYCAWVGNAQINQSGGTITAANLDSATDGGNGEFNLSGGTFNITGTASLGYRYATNFVQSGGSAIFKNLMLGGGYSGGAGTANYTISGAGQLTITSGGSFFVGGNNGGSGNFYVNGGTTTVNADMYVGANTNTNGTVTQTAGAVTIDPANALRFRSTGSYSGAYNLNGGTLTLANIAHTNAATQRFNFGGGTLRANGNLNTSMPMTLGAGGGTVDTAGHGVALSGLLSGTGGLTKRGAGTLTLNQAETYQGATVIQAGTLALTGAGSLAASPVIRVDVDSFFDVTAVGGLTLASNQILAGNGTVLGSVTIGSPATTGSAVSPGASPGLLTTGSETWGPGGTYIWEIDDAAGTAGANHGAGTGWDFLAIHGALDITADAAQPFVIEIHGPPANLGDFGYWTIATATGGITGFDATDFLLDASGFGADFGNFAIFQHGNSIVLGYVPEPSSLALAGLGALALGAWLWRRRR